jgi:hypothetical protein
MNTTPHDAFAVTPTGPHTANAVHITQAGKPVDGAKPMQVCNHCFTARQGGGLSIGWACTNGRGFTEAQGGAA